MLPEAFKGLKRARYNPMDAMGDPAAPEFHANCSKLAASIIPEEEGENRHFSDGGRQACSAVVAALIRHEVPEKRNLVEVARIFSSINELCAFSRAAMQSRDRFIVDKLASFASPDAETSRELGDVARTAAVQLGFVQNEGMAQTLSSSDFHFRDLKKKAGTTVYICLPLEMDVCEKLYRIMTECFLLELLREGRVNKEKQKVMAIIDEAAMLGGYMRSLENAVGMGAGAAGVQLFCIYQSLVQLKSQFKSWESFIQSCGVTAWWGCRSETDREYVSKLGGITEVLTRTRSVGLDRQTKEAVISGNISQHSRALILPHEVDQLKSDEMIVFVEGANGPILARRKFYWLVCQGYRKNPYIKNSK
jgi:type IV secretion system protein VirD4